MAQLCAQSIDDLCITINSVADDQSKLAAATGAYNGLKKFIDQLPSLPSPPALADLSLDKEEDYPVSVLNKCSDLVRMCCQFHRSSAAALGRLNDYITGFKDAYATVRRHRCFLM
ncbi:hypothetical protein niasHT_009809 [Heterodera trifolii]|uniref:Uncharacterized protein n=1 Tax=Heterodera trifolii TaxID=157864 RepID=A0ABD2LRM8_9BILA